MQSVVKEVETETKHANSNWLMLKKTTSSGIIMLEKQESLVNAFEKF